MTVPTARTIARTALVFSLGFNTAAVLTNTLAGRYEAAAVQSILVGLLTAWLWLVPKIDAWLDARLAEAVAQQAVAEIALTEMQRMQRRGELQVGLRVEGPSERMH